MSPMESFETEVNGGVVRGSLRLPKASAPDAPSPAVMICRGLHVEGDDAAGLFDDLSDGLIAAGISVARFEHRAADLILEDFDTHSVADELDDAQAVHAWLSANPLLDRNHIGVIGYALGAIAACGLSKRTQAINRMCLISPTTADHLRNRLTRSNGSPAALDPARIPKSYLAGLEALDSTRDAAFHNRPTLIVHGAADRFIGQEVSLEYSQSLELAGRDVARVLVARADHAFTEPGHRAACVQCATRFFNAMVQEPILAGHS